MTLVMSSITNVFATGIRSDSGDDVTDEGHECWQDGYESGFAGKYDSNRARECIEHDDNYNDMWDYGCGDALRTEEECRELINNPVEIKDFEALYDENKATCRMYGVKDGKANEPFDKERAFGCDEFSGYRDGYQFGCETHTTESSCTIQMYGEKYYCYSHPDIVACVDFLHNATNKISGQASTETTCSLVNVTCQHEINPEKYCLTYNDPVFCRTVGDLR